MPLHQPWHAQIIFSNSISLTLLTSTRIHMKKLCLKRKNNPRCYAFFFRNATQIAGLSFEQGLVAFVGFAKGYKETPGEGQLFHTPHSQALLRFLGFGTQHISVGHLGAGWCRETVLHCFR